MIGHPNPQVFQGSSRQESDDLAQDRRRLRRRDQEQAVPALPATRRQDAGCGGVRGVGFAVPRVHPARNVRDHIPALRRQLSEVIIE